jgi:hypothetical protein
MKGMVSLFIGIQILDKIYYVLSSGPESQLREKIEQFFKNCKLVKSIKQENFTNNNTKLKKHTKQPTGVENQASKKLRTKHPGN